MEINLKEEIKSFRGLPYINADGSPMTVKDALLEQVGSYRAKSGAESIKVYALGQAILASVDILRMDADDVALLKTTFDQPGLPAAVAGFVLAKIG
ncbi:MAG: hypothetical protein MUC33_01320 [Desulfobacterales bacterium]|jgi:hypothetical protein|nr:hypothetical protein [Desulfobacterales bacterium]MCU0601283.1 hypothetical protein [Desulfobacterales bacterium]